MHRALLGIATIVGLLIGGTPAVAKAPGATSGGDDHPVLYPIAVDGRYGYIDATGAVVIEPRFDAVQPFFEGRAGVQQGEVWGFVDARGKLVVKPQYEEVAAFSGGRAAVRLDGKVGFVDRKGKRVIEPTLEGADNFVDGRALVSIPAEDDGAAPRFGYIDDGGAPAFEATFAAAAAFSDGRATVSSDGAAWGYIDAAGATVIAEQFADAHPFAEGLATVRTADGAWQVIDAQGAVVFRPSGFVGGFTEGRAGAEVDGLYGFVDATGALVVPAQYRQVGTFDGGLAPVLADSGQVGFVDPQGALAIEARFDDTTGFRGPLAHVRDGLRWGYVGRDGGWVWTPPAPVIPDDARATFDALVGQEVAAASYPYLVDGAVALTALVGVYTELDAALADARVHGGWEVIVPREVGGARYLGVFASVADYLLRELSFQFREGFGELWIVEVDSTAEQAFAGVHDARAGCRVTDEMVVEFLAANPGREADVPQLRHLTSAVGGGVRADVTMVHEVE